MCPTSPDPLLCNVVFLTSTAHCQPEQLLGSALVSHHVTMQKKSPSQELGTGQLYTFNIAWMGLQGKSSNIFEVSLKSCTETVSNVYIHVRKEFKRKHGVQTKSVTQHVHTCITETWFKTSSAQLSHKCSVGGEISTLFSSKPEDQ